MRIKLYVLLLKYCMITCLTQIGEGSFAEVFLLPSLGVHRPEVDVNSFVLKVMPVDGKYRINGSPQTRY